MRKDTEGQNRNSRGNSGFRKDTEGQGGTPDCGQIAVTQGAASVVWAATLPDSGPTGGFFRDGEPLSW